MKYHLCLVYGEESSLHEMDDHECVAYDEELRRRRICVASEALQPVTAAVTVRVRGGKVTVSDGPFGKPRRPLPASI